MSLLNPNPIITESIKFGITEEEWDDIFRYTDYCSGKKNDAAMW